MGAVLVMYSSLTPLLVCLTIVQGADDTLEPGRVMTLFPGDLVVDKNCQCH